jgi:hypothetical protein
MSVVQDVGLGDYTGRGPASEREDGPPARRWSPSYQVRPRKARRALAYIPAPSAGRSPADAVRGEPRDQLKGTCGIRITSDWLL